MRQIQVAGDNVDIVSVVFVTTKSRRRHRNAAVSHVRQVEVKSVTRVATLGAANCLPCDVLHLGNHRAPKATCAIHPDEGSDETSGYGHAGNDARRR